MTQVKYASRDDAFEQLNRFVGTWLDEDGSISGTYEWMPGHNFMVQYVGENGASGLMIIGYDEDSGKLKSHFYASDKEMLDNGGRPITYTYNIQGNDFELALDGMPDREGSFIGKFSENDTVLKGDWNWTQKGEKMGYSSTVTKKPSQE